MSCVIAAWPSGSASRRSRARPGSDARSSGGSSAARSAHRTSRTWARWLPPSALALRIATYPQGQPIADRVQLLLLAAFRDRLPQSLGWRTEVPLPVAGDHRAWDAVITPPEGWTALEGISRLGAVDATIRRAKLKLRDDPRIERLVLVVLDTTRNRAALTAAAPAIRDDFPLDTRAVLTALEVRSRTGGERDRAPASARRQAPSTDCPQRGKCRGCARHDRAEVRG